MEGGAQVYKLVPADVVIDEIIQKGVKEGVRAGLEAYINEGKKKEPVTAKMLQKETGKCYATCLKIIKTHPKSQEDGKGYWVSRYDLENN